MRLLHLHPSRRDGPQAFSQVDFVPGGKAYFAGTGSGQDGELQGKPGGGVHYGEQAIDAMKREIKEELDTEISVGDLIDTIEYNYPTFHLSMDCFWCEVLSGDLVLKEHEAAKWVDKELIDQVDWLPADVTLIDLIRGFLER